MQTRPACAVTTSSAGVREHLPRGHFEQHCASKRHLRKLMQAGTGGSSDSLTMYTNSLDVLPH